MKIENELISIKIGNKQYDFNNLILNDYLRRFAQFQLDKDNINKIVCEKKLRYCTIKFDTPIDNIESNMNLYNQDFDICLFNGKYSQEISEEEIVINYNWNTDEVFDYKKAMSTGIYSSDYYNRKITAIGFSVWFSPSQKISAILDTSNYNIYLQPNQDLIVTRRDIIKTDALFFSNNKEKIPGPVHLCPNGVEQIIKQPNIYLDESKTSWKSFNDRGYGILYSIGLSSYTDYIDKEFIIGKDIEAVLNETEIDINGLENYLSTDSPLFCGNDVYANSNLYPVRTNYKYVIFKYKVWQKVHSGTYDNVIETITDTGYYYYQAIPIEKFGKSNLKIKYERG